jgi:hypothetical protein
MNHCIDCKKEVKNYKAKRCWNCYVKWSQIPENNKNWKGGVYTKQYYCSDCNKKISASSGAYRGGKCHSCAIKGDKNHFYGIHLSGLLSPTFIDGRSYEPYTVEFSNQLKESIRKRDNYECQNCGKKEIDCKGFQKKLHIHHIDYNKQNCTTSNLITLCITCNVKANSNREYWKKLYTVLVDLAEKK